MEDERKGYVLAAVASHFGLKANASAVTDLADDRHLNAFLDDGNVMLLAASHQVETGAVILDNVASTAARGLLFFKARPDALSPDTLRMDVLIASMADSPVSGLYHALQKVYSPLLLKDAKWSNEFDPKLQVSACL